MTSLMLQQYQQVYYWQHLRVNSSYEHSIRFKRSKFVHFIRQLSYFSFQLQQLSVNVIFRVLIVIFAMIEDLQNLFENFDCYFVQDLKWASWNFTINASVFVTDCYYVVDSDYNKVNDALLQNDSNCPIHLHLDVLHCYL